MTQSISKINLSLEELFEVEEAHDEKDDQEQSTS